MILQLRNKTIHLKENTVPSSVDAVTIRYDFELGTNHYKPVLTINGTIYNEIFPTISLDLNTDRLDIRVDLYDTHGCIMRSYSNNFNYKRLCLIGTDTLVDIYDTLQVVYKENIELKEKGEVI